MYFYCNTWFSVEDLPFPSRQLEGNILFCSMLVWGRNFSYWSVTYRDGRGWGGGGIWVDPRASQQWHNLSTLCAGHDIRRRGNYQTSVEVEMLLLVFNFIGILHLSASSPTLYLPLPFSQVEAARTRLHGTVFAYLVIGYQPVSTLISSSHDKQSNYYLIDCYQSKPIENCPIFSS